MNKILLVGGAGYVGSVLAEELLERGYAVKIFDRLYFGRDGLKNIRDRVELIVGDMRLMDASILKDVGAVINVGGLSNDPTAEYNPDANYQMNTVSTVRLAEFCRSQGVRRYVFASSCSIYDYGVGDEEKDLLLDETSEVRPTAAYSSSKFKAERGLQELAGDDFCPVILRKGTIFGFSPRMRYDLVVNTFIKSALTTGKLSLHYGGEMWRPLVDIHDAARAYIACLEADESKVKGEIFNVTYRNFRISELALRVQKALREIGHDVDLDPVYSYHGVRSYRVSGKKLERTLGVKPTITVEDSVKDLVQKIHEYGYTDFSNPKYYNILWMRLLEEAQDVIGVTGSVFDVPKE